MTVVNVIAEMNTSDMNTIFLIIATFSIIGAVGAITLRNLVHCILSLMLGFLGIAALYLLLGAQFVGLVQILVYLGAVGILFIFVVMVARGSKRNDLQISRSSLSGYALVAGLFLILLWGVLSSRSVSDRPSVSYQMDADHIGINLVRNFVLPLEIGALLLTVALIGAVIAAIFEVGVHDGKNR